jgi:hypothetical protein
MPTDIKCVSCGAIWNSTNGAPTCAQSYCSLKKYWAKVMPSPVASLSNSNGFLKRSSVNSEIQNPSKKEARAGTRGGLSHFFKKDLSMEWWAWL